MQDIQAKMAAELQQALAVCEAEVLAFIEPLEQVGGWGGVGGWRRWVGHPMEGLAGFRGGCCRGIGSWVPPRLCTGRRAHLRPPHPIPPLQLTAAEVRRLEEAEGGRGGLVDSLDSLKQRVANLE